MATPASTIVVAGAGASLLVDELIASGHRVVAVDISSAALEVVAARVGLHDDIQFRHANARDVEFDRPIDAWHDRAVFHFLIEPHDQRQYASNVAAAVRPGGHLVIASFATTGPTRCSNLPTARHDADSLTAIFAPWFELHDSFEADHVTPWGTTQRFVHAVLQRR